MSLYRPYQKFFLNILDFSLLHQLILNHKQKQQVVNFRQVPFILKMARNQDNKNFSLRFWVTPN
jgi:hypothetical protein